MDYYPVYSGRSQTIHVMHHRTSHPPPSGIVAQVVLGPTGVGTLCGRVATRSADIFTVEEATCRECKRRWKIDTGQRAHPRLEANPEYAEIIKALKSGKVRVEDVFAAAGRRFSFGGSAAAGEMPVFQLLTNVPGLSPARAESILKELRILPGNPVRMLSEKNRGKLLARIHGIRGM